MNKTKYTHIIVDMLYDFIDGSLACSNAENAVKKSIEYINAHPHEKVLYVCDCHPYNHSSFKDYGGIWPAHCVNGTRGGSIHNSYFSNIKEEDNRPSNNNIYLKGTNVAQEQYSGYEAINSKKEFIHSDCEKNIIISGIATEYCIKNTALDFLNNGFKVTIIRDGLGYVDKNGHEAALNEMQELGIEII